MGDTAFAIEIPHEIAQNWGWFLAFGIGLVALGIAAVATYRIMVEELEQEYAALRDKVRDLQEYL